MGRSDYLKLGSWDAICDVCGFKYKADQLKLRWDGLMVCPHDWEYRHPQDFVRGVQDNTSTPWSRPGSTDVFVSGYSCNSRTSIPGYATPGCAIPSNTTFPSLIIQN